VRNAMSIQDGNIPFEKSVYFSKAFKSYQN